MEGWSFAECNFMEVVMDAWGDGQGNFIFHKEI